MSMIPSQNVGIDVFGNPLQLFPANPQIARLHCTTIKLRSVIKQRSVAVPADLVDDRAHLGHQTCVEHDASLFDALDFRG
jgi:hypothetical protein